MKSIAYTCDWCGHDIDGKFEPGAKENGLLMAGGGGLCTLEFKSSMGHNGFLNEKHYHFACFCEVVPKLSKPSPSLT